MNKWRRLLLAGLGVLVVLSLSIGTTQYYQRQQLQRLVDKPQEVPKWTADPRPLQSVAATKALFNQVNRANNPKEVTLRGMKFGVIPGLRGAWSINHRTKKAAFGTDWVPQGLTQSADKYFISAYDGDHQLNSLIFQMDKKTRQYEKTLILNSKAHVGGITYEDQHRQLIYSDDTGGHAGFGVIKQTTIDQYDPVVKQAAIKAKKIIFALGSRTSAITTYRDLLVVAKYGKKETDRSIILIPTNKNGLPREITVAQINRYYKAYLHQTKKKQNFNHMVAWLIKKNIISAYYPGWNHVQGVSMLDNGLAVMTQSAGQQPSTLLLKLQNYNNQKTTDFDFSAPTKGASRVKMPHSIEEVSINRQMNELSMIFESGARKYREDGFGFWFPTYIDRFAILPMTLQTAPSK